MDLTNEERTKFWTYVDKTNDCWLWIGGKYDGRYGSFKVGGKSKRAHRVAHFLATGEKPPVVRHSCDVPLCCNPAHLKSGTQLQNIQDAIERGQLRGEAHRLLTYDEVLEVRARHAAGEGQTALGRVFGVSYDAIHRIVHGKTRVEA